MVSVAVTENSSKTINRIEAVLINIESRTDKASTNGADVTAIRALIADAETAITNARTAITEQSGKVYDITIIDDSTLKNSLQATRDLFKKDIQAMKEKVKVAYDAVKKVAGALKAIPRVNDEVPSEDTN